MAKSKDAESAAKRRAGEQRTYDAARRLLLQSLASMERPEEFAKNIEDQLMRDVERELQHGIERGEVRRAFYDLFLSGVVTFACINAGVDAIHLTPHGRAALASSSPNPYEPERYLAGIARHGVSQLVLDYVTEATRAMNGGFYRAGAVVIGAATEALLHDLTERVKPLERQQGRPKFELGNDWKAARAAKDIIHWFLNPASGLPASLVEKVRNRFEPYLNPIREVRNSVGHPAALGDIEREDAYASFLLFPEFVKLWVELRVWLDGQAS